MRLWKETYRSRNDFKATYRCEHCDHLTEPQWGYHDWNFHHNVIPKMKCPECGKSSRDEAGEDRKQTGSFAG